MYSDRFDLSPFHWDCCRNVSDVISVMICELGVWADSWHGTPILLTIMSLHRWTESIKICLHFHLSVMNKTDKVNLVLNYWLGWGIFCDSQNTDIFARKILSFTKKMAFEYHLEDNSEWIVIVIKKYQYYFTSLILIICYTNCYCYAMKPCVVCAP